ncbi:MAG: choice-of-anchor Q domain-containing protein [Wenzhouxiangellaceae bacterium]|nr:choice-of-anchor Q domain-containing protein [Wenzhouxiangellaceae bacterium]
MNHVLSTLRSVCRSQSVLIGLLANLGLMVPGHAQTVDIAITSIADSGPGTLRAALLRALENTEPDYRITFSNLDGTFDQPRVIRLEQPLPIIEGRVRIDGFLPGMLWKAYGVTISGGSKFGIFEIAAGGELRIEGLTLRDGRADRGAAIANHGRLIAEGVSFFENHATGEGGAIFNHGAADLINSTLAWNQATHGGALANLAGNAHLVHVTAHENDAQHGAAVWSSGRLHLANSILSGSTKLQCENQGELSHATTHNLIHGGSRGCGEPLLLNDPKLGALGHYNGPTQTLPVSSDSPVLNRALDAAAVDAEGRRLTWDQRGNGDPRFAAGYADLGAFERQSHLPAEFVVNTTEDNGSRACTRAGTSGNCPLRAALELAARARHPVPVHFDADVFDTPTTLVLDEMPVDAAAAIEIDGAGAATVTIKVPGPIPAWRLVNGVIVEASIGSRP